MSWAVIIAFAVGLLAGIATTVIIAIAVNAAAIDEPDPRSQRRG